MGAPTYLTSSSYDDALRVRLLLIAQAQVQALCEPCSAVPLPGVFVSSCSLLQRIYTVMQGLHIRCEHASRSRHKQQTLARANKRVARAGCRRCDGSCRCNSRRQRGRQQRTHSLRHLQTSGAPCCGCKRDGLLSLQHHRNSSTLRAAAARPAAGESRSCWAALRLAAEG